MIAISTLAADGRGAGDGKRHAFSFQKSAVARPWERKFLGFSFTSRRQPKRRIAPKVVGRFKAWIRELTYRTRGVNIARMAGDLTQYLRGWIGYFGKCETPSTLQSLEEWTRRRLRSAIWKQWKRGRVRFAELRKRQVALTAHGGWRTVLDWRSHCQCLLRLARDSEIDGSLIAQPAEPPDADPHVRWCGRGGVVRLPLSRFKRPWEK